jgi:Uma2 family endonuclease
MSSQVPLVHLTVEDYLEGERSSPVRHEYIAGQVYAMAGASQAHNTIALNLATRFRGHTRGGPCRVFMSDLKVRVEATNSFYYPDVVVSCDPTDREEYFVARPCLIVEISSPSTEAIDRREKLVAYQRIDSLREYVLIAQDEVRAHVYRRDNMGDWWIETLAPDDELRLELVGLNIPLAELYEDI